MLTNDKMIAGRFAKLAKGRSLMRKMNAVWDAGGFVRVGTALGYTDFKAKHRALVVMGVSGSIYQLRGKGRVCLDFCSFQFGA